VTVLETPRLVLREFDLDDAEFVVQLLNEPSFLRFIGDKGVRTLADARDYLLKGPIESYRRFGVGLYLVSLREDGTPIGMCGLVKREGLADVDVGFALR
jgi:RimJ/RimL family protein N-acetyltransferase